MTDRWLTGPGTGLQVWCRLDAALLGCGAIDEQRDAEPRRYHPMMDSERELSLHEAAVAVAKEQAQRNDDGAGVGAAALTDDGEILTGIWIDAMVDSACLCAETGPISEAHRRGRRLTASICVHWTRSAGPSVLAACGVCQERLAVFGSDLLVGVADASERGHRFESLATLRPFPWWESVGDDSGSVESGDSLTTT